MMSRPTSVLVYRPRLPSRCFAIGRLRAAMSGTSGGRQMVGKIAKDTVRCGIEVKTLPEQP